MPESFTTSSKVAKPAELPTMARINAGWNTRQADDEEGGWGMARRKKVRKEEEVEGREEIMLWLKRELLKRVVTPR
jgi:hypothetical protein